MFIGLSLDLTRKAGAGASPLLSGLIHYWTMEETSGNRSDSVGSATLTDNNTVGSNTGKIGTAADFVAANVESFSYSAGVVDLGDSDYTFAHWVYLNSGSGNWRHSFSALQGTNVGFLMRCNPSNIPEWHVRGANDHVDWTSAISTNAWHLIVVWHDAVNNQIGIQVDNGTPVSGSTAGAPAAASTIFYVGAYQTTFLMDGRIDELGMWNRVLTTAERTELWNGGAGKTYPFT